MFPGGFRSPIRKERKTPSAKGWTFGEVNIQGEPVARGWKRDTILVSPSFCLFDSVHLFSEAGERGGEGRRQGRWFRRVCHDSQIGMKLEIWNLHAMRIGSFVWKHFYFSGSFLRNFRKEREWIIGISEVWNLVKVDSFFDLKEKDFLLVSDYLIWWFDLMKVVDNFWFLFESKHEIYMNNVNEHCQYFS